jgi:LAO/AO transport system kinase
LQSAFSVFRSYHPQCKIILAVIIRFTIIGAMNSHPAPSNIGDLAALRAGGKRALAAALAAVERAPAEASIAALVDEAYLAATAHVIGFTGPPGVGKSSLIDALIKRWRASGVRVGVIAVDPSSHLTHGALLGDRIRIRTDPEDNGVFVRSLASRGTLGGLTEAAFPAVVLMRALFDRVVVETVGVGQSEADISTVADTVALCVQPGSGDSLQFMKAGIMEIPDVAVVTKADMGASAIRVLADLKGALGLASANREGIGCHLVSVTKMEGLDAFLAALDTRFTALSDATITVRRQVQAEGWLRSTILHHHGEAGLAAAAHAMVLPLGVPPFGYCQNILDRLYVGFRNLP